ncbi:hypothetical protein GCM10027059_30380 [Myceligenerans halotolerans]
MPTGQDTHDGERVEVKFKAAWDAFAWTCSTFVAPEAAFQAWFAHYLISQFGIDRVAREPIVRIGTFMDSPWKARLGGSGEAKLDVVVTRRPGVHLPHYAGLTRSSDGTGLETLKGLAAIAELKVGSSVANGLDHRAVANDVWKLSMLLDEFELGHPGVEPPLAYACVLDNHPRRHQDRAGLDRLLSETKPHPGVCILYRSSHERPADTGPRGKGPEPRRLVPPPGRWDGVTPQQ